MWQRVKGQEPHPLLQIPAVGGDDVTLALSRGYLLQGLADAARQLGLGRGLVRRLPAPLHSSLQSARMLGGAQGRLRQDARLRGLTGARLWRRTEVPGLAVVLVWGRI